VKPSRSSLLALLSLPLAAACSSWEPVRRADGWTLYVQEEAPADVESYEASLDAGHAEVEQ
jgi:hypothetical protein